MNVSVTLQQCSLETREPIILLCNKNINGFQRIFVNFESHSRASASAFHGENVKTYLETNILFLKDVRILYLAFAIEM